MSEKYVLDGHYYQYDLGWLIDKLLSFENTVNQIIDLQTIHYADPIQWNITTQYAPNTVVVDENTGTAYMSKKAVPSGILLSNTDYWVVIFNYQKIYEDIMKGVATYNSETTAEKSFSANDLVWLGTTLYRVTSDIGVGGKFVVGKNIAQTSVESLLEKYYGKNRYAQLDNDTLDVVGDLTVDAGDISETSVNRTEHITKDREIDVDGTDSVHVDGASTLNVGGLRTETFADNYGKTVTGSATETYKGSLTQTVAGKTVVNATDYTFHNSNVDYNIKHARHTVLDYGAKGDGKTDDSQAIMKMIYAEGYALFPAGTFKCNLTIETAGVTLIGYNKRTSILSAYDSTRDVVQVTQDGKYFCASDLMFTGGLNGLHIVNGIGNNITNCMFVSNSQDGYFQEGKNSSDNSELTHISKCYAELNGTSGFHFSEYPDWSMSECEGVSNASEMNKTGSANLKVYGNCAGKIVNSHFWNYNDYLKHYRPKTSVQVEKAYCEFVNCHIEGGYECVLVMSSSPSVFTNCLFYASFGSYSIWLSDCKQATFIGCTFNGQASDDVAYKPTWVGIFNGNSTKGVISNCWIYGKIFCNSNFTSWTIDARGTTANNTDLANIGTYTDIKYQSDAQRRNLNALIMSGETSVDITKFNCIYVTSNVVTITGAPYNGQQLVIANSTSVNTTITAPSGYTFMGVGSKLTIPGHMTALCIFTTDTIFVVGV